MTYELSGNSELDNYTFNGKTPANGSFTEKVTKEQGAEIKRRPVTITIADQTVPYDGQQPEIPANEPGENWTISGGKMADGEQPQELGVTLQLATIGTVLGCVLGFVVGMVRSVNIDKHSSVVSQTILRILKQSSPFMWR